MCPPGCHHNGFMATTELGHRMYGYTLWGRIALWSHQSAQTASSEQMRNANSERPKWGLNHIILRFLLLLSCLAAASGRRKLKIIWFNPPYSMNVKTNIAREFLQLLDKHFHANHHLHMVFNRNNVKVSYSCMPNTSSIIKAHNKRILQDQHATATAEAIAKIGSSAP